MLKGHESFSPLLLQKNVRYQEFIIFEHQYLYFNKVKEMDILKFKSCVAILTFLRSDAA